MNRFLGFLKKEFYHILRDKRSLFILFGMPVAQILLFGYAITNEIKDVHIGIVDHSKDEVTEKLIDKILASGYFILQDDLKTDKELDEAFKKGDIKEAIIFEHNFAQHLVLQNKADMQILADATDPNTASTLISYTSAIVNDFLHGMNENKIQPMQIQPEVRMMFNPELKGVFFFVPGVMTIILMLVSAMMTSISITREKEMGTMEVLMVSPLKPLPILLGKVIPYLFLSFFNIVFILSLGVFVFGMPIKGSLILLFFECSLFVVTALSIGILISTVAKTQQTAMMMSMMGLMLPTIMLSGYIFPIESMPKVLQIISNIIPARWFISIIKDVMLKGNGIYFVWKETLILAGMAFFFLFVSARKFKLRMQ